MLNNFIGGGQVFLHKIRMLMQVLSKSFTVSILVSLTIMIVISYKPAQKLDLSAFVTYQKAYAIESFDQIFSGIRKVVNPKVKEYVHYIDAYTQQGTYAKHIATYKVLDNPLFQSKNQQVVKFIKARILVSFSMWCIMFCLIYFVWSRFGKDIKAEKYISGAIIKNAKEVRRILNSSNKASNITIGSMPLVQNSETKHMIINGSTGSGKTNLLHNILPQIVQFKHPSILLDQTGEMIARYYNPERGDIIFNPLDTRSHSWNFWHDSCSTSLAGSLNPRLEKFAKVLFKYGKKPYSGSDPFWDNSSEVIFCACVEYLVAKQDLSFASLQKMLTRMSLETLGKLLTGTKASRYLNENNKTTASSILSVMATNTKPLSILTSTEKQFSLQKYFEQIAGGSKAWLFLSSPPHLRELTMPLNACLFELAISYLMEIGINDQRRIWFIIDELASLGRLNGFSTLMLESRKYGGCVIAATQSLNQLFENFGAYAGSSLFGQFGTKVVFHTDEPAATKIISDICGKLEYSQQQKNTSFGANEFRDGISYTESTKHKAVITTDTLASLADNNCFVFLPEPSVRIAKITIPISKTKDIHSGFVQTEASEADITNNQSTMQ